MKKTTNSISTTVASVFAIAAVFAGTAIANNEGPQGEAYYEQVMGAPPLLPANAEQRWQACAPAIAPASDSYKTVRESGVSKGWVERSVHDWSFFDASAEDGKVLVIDYARKGEELAFRYLANAQTHDDLYEPWSSSKIMAYSGALSLLSDNFAQPDTTVGDLKLADLITSVHSYEASGAADGNSNAYAYYLANLAGRDYLTALFHDAWLHIGQPQVKFRGAYGPAAYAPVDRFWRTPSRSVSAAFVPYDSDPGMLGYRCEDCGLTGNKPMTTLVSAEFLKRLATHKRVPETRMPGLSDDAVMMLFYGPGHSANSANAGGMMAGASLMPHRAIAAALKTHLPELAELSTQQVLDQATAGNWRIFHKLGAGPSETRGTSEVVALAHVCLPLASGTREFTVAAQASVAGNSYENVGIAGAKLERLLTETVQTLLTNPAN
ncbi:hypothetical protein [Pseudidiomarina terrestris]|uniref:hypothetical protein n=1 Tax=Pseudidiomarina terrestris TaxID=2820060 RepID=UPI00264C1C25|nr:MULTISPECIES: hypothetical protein [unclassified Pseudidiomarina]MDN7126105.1 hypothetical protein [Pseudidiomarina sp. 1APR75-33.1]MDN7134133.1 hypothetical protein [Pseudidiomarina sp. 1ASP75-5]